jgi:hypothetical protein
MTARTSPVSYHPYLTFTRTLPPSFSFSVRKLLDEITVLCSVGRIRYSLVLINYSFASLLQKNYFLVLHLLLNVRSSELGGDGEQDELIGRWQWHLLFRPVFAGHVTSASPCQQIAKVGTLLSWMPRCIP